ncbi:hypothetical protein U1769_11725 [Sphingomonas sp. ZT3P38]|uniref:hypothetical protein n=1 Tax=Parasphingomonas zepuensis TaxID=3096161 RepID=UPI002FCAF291
MRAAVTIGGILVLLMGLLWIGQGSGYIHWPASSFMLEQRIWMLWGALLAIAGIVLIRIGRR